MKMQRYGPPPVPTRWESPPPAAHDLVEQEIPLRIQYPQLLWRKKWWILAFLLAGTTVGFVRVVMQPPVYRAAATIEIVGINESFMGMNQVDPQAGLGNYSATVANIQTQSRVLTSRTMLNRVVERVNLEMTPLTTTQRDLFSRLRNRLGLTSQEPVKLMRQAVQEAAVSTRARGVGASRLMELTCESTAPEVAATFANALAAEYVSQNAQFRSSTALRTTQWLEGQLEDAKSRVEQADAKLQEFVQKSGLAFVLDQNTLDNSKLRQLQADLSAIQADRITKQSRWELAKSSPIDSLPEILDDGRLKELRGRITELRQERAQLRATLAPAHHKVQRVDSQIAEIEQTLEREKANLLKRIQNEYEAALRQEKLLSASYRGQSRSLAGQAGHAAQYGGLKREVAMASETYNNLLQQLNQSAVIAALPTNNVRIVDQAVAGVEPVSPRPLRDIPGAAALWGAIGIGLIVLLERVRTKKLAQVFLTPGHSGSTLQLPELGVIPTAERYTPRRLRKLPFSSLNGKTTNGNGADRALIAWPDEPSFFAESFRYALTSLFSQAPWPQVMVVTSPGPGEGKTTFVSNLAIAAAVIGHNVLVIDADLRRARLHKAFKTSIAPGLKEALTGIEPIESLDLETYLRSTEVPGLRLLPAGELNAGGSVSQLLFSNRLAPLLAKLKRQFDTILIDTAPVMTFPDARLVGRLADGVVIVVRAGVTHRESALAVAQRFAMDHVPVLGTVLNDWDRRGSQSQGYYGHAEDYHDYHKSQ